MFNGFFKTLAQGWKDFLYFCGYFLSLWREVLLFPSKRRVGLKVLVMQIYFTGVETLPVIALISLSIGAVIIIQGVGMLTSFGQGALTYKILILIIMRELGPLLTAFIITARSGSAITTELGNMVISHEMEAYMSVGLHPISQIAVPRLIGVTTAIFILNIYFILFGLFGAYVVANFIHAIPFLDYLRNLVKAIGLGDILSSLIKSFVFGVLIATISTYFGFSVNHAVTEVPQKTIKSISYGIVGCILADAVITIISHL
jgi:phospholipid/cholesterol/gamma-HCH transport system permease protein